MAGVAAQEMQPQQAVQIEQLKAKVDSLSERLLANEQQQRIRPAAEDAIWNVGVNWEPLKIADLALAYERDEVDNGSLSTSSGRSAGPPGARTATSGCSASSAGSAAAHAHAAEDGNCHRTDNSRL